MTNRLETALEQVGNVFIEMAKEIRTLKEEIADLQIMIHNHETLKDNMIKVLTGGEN